MPIGDNVPWGNSISCVMIPPTDLEIDDADLVASLSQSFKKMMGLMGPSFDPIRFLDDENAQRIKTLNA